MGHEVNSASPSFLSFRQQAPVDLPTETILGEREVDKPKTRPSPDANGSRTCEERAVEEATHISVRKQKIQREIYPPGPTIYIDKDREKQGQTPP